MWKLSSIFFKDVMMFALNYNFFLIFLFYSLLFIMLLIYKITVRQWKNRWDNKIIKLLLWDNIIKFKIASYKIFY